MKQSLALIMLAAGKGSRMKSDLPKVLHPVAGRAMGLRVLDSATNALSPHRILTVYSDDKVKENFSAAYPEIEFVSQSQQNGTGHAVLICEEALQGFKGTVVVVFGDAPLLPQFALQQLVAVHKEQGNKLTTITAMAEDPASFGRILRDETGKFLGTVEKKDATPDQLDIMEVATAIFAVEAEDLFRWLNQVEPSPATGEIYLNGIEKLALAEGAPVGTITAEDAMPLVGCNTPEELAAAEAYLNQPVEAEA